MRKIFFAVMISGLVLNAATTFAAITTTKSNDVPTASSAGSSSKKTGDKADLSAPKDSSSKLNFVSKFGSSLKPAEKQVEQKSNSVSASAPSQRVLTSSNLVSDPTVLVSGWTSTTNSDTKK